ncbi:MAG: TatD family hydrolase [Candidatus Paceibacterota bacterium]
MTQLNYIDIHAHFDTYEPEERQAVLGRMREHGVHAIAVGTDVQSSQSVVRLAREEESVSACVGVHPDASRDADLDMIAGLAGDPQVVAIGECGFDYFRREGREGGGSDRDDLKPVQQAVFERQVELAVQYQKPLMLHVRPAKDSMDAYEDTLELLESYAQEHGEALGGNAHFFAGTVEHARRFLEIGFTLSFTGVITFTNDYDEVIRYIPSDMLHAETDSPFVAPVPYRGKQNEPSYVQHVVERLARIRDEDPQVLGKALVDNARRLFGV